ncbi:MAG TPA: cyclase family protein [Xanthomonadales bacterium]|nr:cyclase family protein [Xanthomonadales bacterium]
MKFSTQRYMLAPSLALALVCTAGQVQAGGWHFDQGQWIDLSHAYDDKTIYWPTANGFSKTTDFEGHTDGGWYYTAYSVCTAEHGGTHLDAPIHFAEGMQTSDQLSLDRLIAPAVVIDVTGQANENRDFLITGADIANWEKTNGRIPAGSIVLFRTGFASRWPDAASYLGTAERGSDAVPKLHFPGLSADAAEYLVAYGDIAAIGIDTASIDYGQSADFIAHRILFAAGIPAFENVADMSALPVTGALVVALPMKIAGGSGGPLRIVAFVPE